MFYKYIKKLTERLLALNKKKKNLLCKKIMPNLYESINYSNTTQTPSADFRARKYGTLQKTPATRTGNRSLPNQLVSSAKNLNRPEKEFKIEFRSFFNTVFYYFRLWRVNSEWANVLRDDTIKK